MNPRQPLSRSMQYRVRHSTTYDYADAVPLCQNQAHLTPRNFARQNCLFSRLNIAPAPVTLDRWRDYFGNVMHYFSVEELHRQLVITAESIVERLPAAYPAPDDTPPWESVRDAVAAGADADCLAAAHFTFESPFVRFLPQAKEYAAASFAPGRPLLAAALDLTARIHRDFKYSPAATSVNTPTSEVLVNRRGVCQDFAHLEITCLRSLGLPARYVSGYLVTDPPPGQPKLIGTDASHAWISVFVPGRGFLDFDPSNNQMPDQRHITVAWGRDYRDVCPIQGVFIGGQHSMRVAVDVAPHDGMLPE